MKTAAIYSTRLVDKGTENTHSTICQDVTLEEAQAAFNEAKSGMEVDVILINTETGEEIARK